MKWNVLQPRISQSLLIGLYRRSNIVFMVMQYDCDHVQALGKILVSRLIDMQVEPYQQGASEYKSGEVRTSPFWNLQRFPPPFSNGIIPHGQVNSQEVFYSAK